MATTQGALGRESNSRWMLYFLFGLMAAVPIGAFALGPLTSDSFDLQGPLGPGVAFSAGVLSFVSPCVLPLVPIYITHLSGATIERGQIVADRRVTFTHAAFFLGALSLVFIALGASVGLVGSYVLKDNQREMEQIAGLFLVFMGLVLIPAYGKASPMRAALVLLAMTAVYFFLAETADLKDDQQRLAVLGIVVLLAWLKFAGYLRLAFFSRTFEIDVGRGRQASYGRSALIGGAFALGWTPCVGPILGSILTLAATESASAQQAWTSVYLLAFYSMGFSIPFLITALALSDVSRFLQRISRYTGVIEVASGVMLVGLGVLLVTGTLTGLNDLFTFADFNQGL